MHIKIVVDSSANLHRPRDPNFAEVPLKILTDNREFSDDEGLDTEEMLSYMENYSGRSGTSCPSVGDWLEAFDGAEAVFAVSITSGLSGCYNAAVQAAQIYTEEHPNCQVCCLDSLSTGPEMVLIVEKLQELIGEELDFQTIEQRIRSYMETTHLLFMLERMDNLANNGRVSSLVAKAAGLLGIRVVGAASEKGTLHSEHKCRGEKKALAHLFNTMVEQGYQGGKVRLAHCCNEAAAKALTALILTVYPRADIDVHPCGGLCCFYAERGGLLAGYETV